MNLVTQSFSERTLSIPAELSRLPEARRFAEQAAADFGFEPAARAQIKLAINEAVANAVEHGSSSPDDEVELRAVEEVGALTVYVVDGGSFVPPMLPRGSLPEGEELPERGRGMVFMDLLMDEVDVQPGAGGTVIRLSRRSDS